MLVKEKSITEINGKIEHGNVLVLTEGEFLKEIQKGNNLSLADIDVVTVARNASASGTAAMLCVPVADRGEFTRARKIWINGIPGFPGPAPNERLGLVDVQVFADQVSRNSQAGYNGADLFLDIIGRKEIQAECLSVEGDTFRNTFTLDDLEFARLYVYNYFFDLSNSDKCPGDRIQHLNMIRQGSKILLNKTPGIVIGCGTRSTPDQKALSLAADMFEMDIESMKKSETDTEVSVTNSVALAIPILTQEVVTDLAACLMGKKPQETENSIQSSEEGMAGFLKQLIEKGEFKLISSDMYLNNWC